MENNEVAVSSEAAAEISIEYYGEAREEAENMRTVLAQSSAQVNDVRERDVDDLDLAVAEIIITVVATAAAKTAVSIALAYFEDYIRQQIEAGKKLPDGQVVIEKDNETVARVPFSFGTTRLEMLATFSKNLRAAIDKI
jgi:hypothetical protein